LSYHRQSPKPQSLELSQNTEKKRLGRREGGEKSKQNVKIRLLFSETETAKQNQKFPFHFLSAPHTPPAKNLKERKENFLVFAPATE